MSNRREFLYMMAMLGSSSLFANAHTRLANSKTNKPEDYYKLDNFGNVRILHMTDSHAQLLPVHFREPSVNLGFHSNFGAPPHIVGEKFLDYYNIKRGTRLAYALSSVDYVADAKRYGKIGGFAHIKYLADYLRDKFGREKTLFLDGGDTWQGSWTALQTRGKDMVEALNILGMDVCTGHWEFTYKDKEVLENLKLLKSDFVAQNVKVKEDALFNETEIAEQSYSIQSESDDGRMFKPYVIKNLKGARVAIVGQAFPYTTIANPAYNMPDWTFAIDPEGMQEVIDQVRSEEKPDAVIVLSHNGFDVDKKMAQVCTGIDFIMGGHTHDGVPEAVPVKNRAGTTYVTNAGSNGKFVNVLDIDIQNGKIRDFKFTLLPVFSNLLPEDKEMKAHIEKVRKPYLKEVTREIATTDDILFRRGNFNGSFDQIICDALTTVKGADISLSPGFRWGTSVQPGDAITFDDIATQTAMTYPETYARDIRGDMIHEILEDVADNLFNKDPFYQQGGDMVRTGGLQYTIDPMKKKGKRITNIRLTKNGQPMEANKTYKVAGWSTVGAKSDGEPVWETVVKYLEDVKHIKNMKVDTPEIIGVKGNPGIV
jgi:sulfur-oxidizing protein SoxB